MIFEENRAVSNIEFIQIISMESYQSFVNKMIIPKLNLYTSFLSSIPMTMTKLFMREIQKKQNRTEARVMTKK